MVCNTNKAQLFEQYRPTSFDDVLGQDKAIKRLRVMEQRNGLSGRAYWISGQSGTGKTTLAYIIAGMVADEWCVNELDASTLRADAIAKIEKSVNSRALGTAGGHAIIINEAHGLSAGSVRKLLVMLERIPSHVVVIFTTTNEGEQLLFENDDASPLLSRCVKLELARRGLADEFAMRAYEIAEHEGLGGKSLKDFKKLVQQERNNMRAVLCAIETGEMMV